MAGFRIPEISRLQYVLWEHRLDDALPPDHSARLILELFESDQFAAVLTPWRREYTQIEA